MAGRVAACIGTHPAPRSCACAVSQHPCAVSQGAGGRIAAPGCTVSRHKVAPLSATIQLLYRDPAPSSAHCASYRRPPGCIMAEQWLCRGLLRRVVARPCALPPSHALYRDSTSKWVVAQPATFVFFFFHIIFFSHSSYWKTTKIIFFFIF